MPQSKAWAVVVLLSMAVIFGGGTRPGFLGDAIVQTAAVATLAALAIGRLAGGKSSGIRFHWLAVAVIALPAMQLLPLPPHLWTGFPTHVAVSDGLILAGLAELPWWPSSVTPSRTVQSLCATLPFVAVFLAVSNLNSSQRRYVSLAIVGLGCANALIGLAQVAQGPSSALRFFEITNLSEAVGTFANRNHYAALLYVMLIFAAAWLVSPMETIRRMKAFRLDTSVVLALAALFVAIVFSLSGQLMARSRAGIGLTMAALLGSYALLSVPELLRNRAGSRIMLAALALAMVLATQFALYRILDRFDADPLHDARISIAQTTFKIALSALPSGSGMGSFIPVFAASETLAGTFSSYVNRAHNELLELALEAGLPGLLLLAGFLVWYCIRLVQTWKRSSFGADTIDVTLMRAASIVVLLLMCHSLVDYPLRTTAMASVFAASCALLTRPQSDDKLATRDSSAPSDADNFSAPSRQSEPRPTRVAVPLRPQSGLPSNEPRTPASPTAEIDGSKVIRNHPSWQPDLEWPEQWRRSRKQLRSKNDDA